MSDKPASVLVTVCGIELPVSWQPATATAPEHYALGLPGKPVSKLGVYLQPLDESLPEYVVFDGVILWLTPCETAAGRYRREYKGRQILDTLGDRHVEVSVTGHESNDTVSWMVRVVAKPMRTTAPVTAQLRASRIADRNSANLAALLAA